MGMLLAASNCPLLAIFQPMVRFHLPFARRDETVYRVLSMYALAQYVHNQQGEDVDVDLEALADMYREIQVVNRSLASRLRTAATTDAPTNAIAILDTFAQIIPCVIEDSLTDLEELFEPYLRKCTRHVRTLHVHRAAQEPRDGESEEPPPLAEWTRRRRLTVSLRQRCSD